MSRARHSLASPSLVLFACLFASQAGLLVLSPILTEIAAEFGVSTATAGQLRTISGATGGVTALLIAFAPRRPGQRDLLTAGAGAVAVASVLSAAAPSYVTLAGAQALMGVGIGLLVAIGIAAAGDWPTREERPKVLAWAIAGMPTAWIVGMPLVGLASASGWRAAWLAVPGAAALIVIILLQLRPRDASTQRTGRAAALRQPDVARFTAAELVASAAWAGVLTYSGALLIDTYGASRATVTLGLAFVAVAMLPGTFTGKRRHLDAGPRLLVGLTLAQGASVVVLGSARPDVAMTLAVLVLMAFTNGWRSMVASQLGMDTAPGDNVGVMSLRAAANQFGYLLGAAAGGIAVAAGGFGAMGVVLAAMFAISAATHAAIRPPALYPEPEPA